MDKGRIIYRISPGNSILVTRNAGKAEQAGILNALACCCADVLYLDFSGVDIIDYSFADEAIAKTVNRLLTGELGEKRIVLTNLSPAWEENLDVALKQRQIAVLAESASGWEVLGFLKDHLRQTLDFVISREYATARELASANGLNVGAANNRLAELWRYKLLRRKEAYGLLEKKKALEMALNQIEKQFGKGSIMKLGEASSRLNVEVIPTGSLALDIALGVGGIPRGRVIEIYGPESSGKTTLALHIIAEAQKTGGIAAFVDAEHALDPVYAGNLGVDIDNLLISQPDTGEQALEIAEALVRSNAIDVVVIDSVAALVPRAELEGEMGDTHVGLQARLMSQALRKLAGAISKSRTVAIFINQLREKVGIMFGNPETTPGGRALKFYASVRLEIRRTEALKQGNDIIGNRTKVKVVKNKVAPPFRQAEFDVIYGQGISREGDAIDIAAERDIVNKSGAWYSYKEERLGQGRENVKALLQQRPELLAEIEQRIREELGVGGKKAKETPSNTQTVVEE